MYLTRRELGLDIFENGGLFQFSSLDPGSIQLISPNTDIVVASDDSAFLSPPDDTMQTSSKWQNTAVEYPLKSHSNGSFEEL